MNFQYNVLYTLPVCILRQMEAIMGRKSYEKDFVSEEEFSQDFIIKYGRELFTFIAIRMATMEY